MPILASHVIKFTLKFIFAASLLILPACVPGSAADREIGRLLGVRSEEERLYCHTIQQQYLHKPVPEIPPPCDAILKQARDQKVVLP